MLRSKGYPVDSGRYRPAFGGYLEDCDRYLLDSGILYCIYQILVGSNRHLLVSHKYFLECNGILIDSDRYLPASGRYLRESGRYVVDYEIYLPQYSRC